MDDIKLSLDEVATLARSCLAAHGCDAANARLSPTPSPRPSAMAAIAMA